MTSRHEFKAEELLIRLKKLEYRGYDSFGYWDGVHLQKQVGKIDVNANGHLIRTAIAHTRWATHGGVTQSNAHPHKAGPVTIVHNGIIENWPVLKRSLEDQGSVFHSDTDSELLAHYVERQLANGRDMLAILETLVATLKGSFATLIMIDGDENIYAAKRDSPLTLGHCPAKIILASDIYAFVDATSQAVFFENDEYAIIGPDSYRFYHGGRPIDKVSCSIQWDELEASREDFPHFMLKEIHEQPAAARRLLNSLGTEQSEAFEQLKWEVSCAEKVVFTAAGTAYHAALLGASFLHQQGLNAQAITASEFETFVTVDESALVIAITQSGETMDVIEALKYASSQGAQIASIVNVPYSTIERMSAFSLQLLAGPEVAVASTKAFTNQVLLLLALAEEFGYKNGLPSLPQRLKNVLDLEPKIQELAARLFRKDHLYIIGRRWGYPVAREIALKIKEVSYVHAEGMMGGELKHGTIALIEPGTPVISLIFDDDPKMRANTKEVEARGAETHVIGSRSTDNISVPAENEAEFAILSAVVGQMLAYHIARCLDLPIDQPRNLAKSVTVS